MRIVSARLILTASAVALAMLLSMTTRPPVAYGQAAHIRWDIHHNTSFSPPTFEAGGFASAFANDNSSITLTGSGTFVAPAGGDGTSRAVTGGGDWATSNNESGTYKVTGLVRWEEAPGAFGPGVIDNIAPIADNRGGLAVLRVEYSDGERGVLTVSCNLSIETRNIFEGITASKGFVSYWNRVAPLPNIDGNRTNFHVVH